MVLRYLHQFMDHRLLGHIVPNAVRYCLQGEAGPPCVVILVGLAVPVFYCRFCLHLHLMSTQRTFELLIPVTTLLFSSLKV